MKINVRGLSIHYFIIYIYTLCKNITLNDGSHVLPVMERTADDNQNVHSMSKVSQARTKSKRWLRESP